MTTEETSARRTRPADQPALVVVGAGAAGSGLALAASRAGWRVDALTVERVTVDPIDGGGAHLKLYTATGHLATTTVGASAVTELAEMIDRLGARRSAEGF